MWNEAFLKILTGKKLEFIVYLLLALNGLKELIILVERNIIWKTASPYTKARIKKDIIDRLAIMEKDFYIYLFILKFN